MIITKDKNILYLRPEENKTYSLNLTTGEWTGLRGTTLKYIPAVVADALQFPLDTPHHINILSFIKTILSRYGRNGGAQHLRNSIPMLSLFERLDALNIQVNVDLYGVGNLWDTSEWKFIHDHFSEYRDYRNGEGSSMSIYDFIATYQRTLWFEENKIPVEHLTEPFLNWLYSVAGRGAMEGDKLRWFLYHAKTLYEFTEFMGSYSNHRALEWFNDYWHYITEAEIKPEKGNFMKLAVEARRTYMARKAEIEAKRLRDYQLSKQTALTFSANGMSVIIPTVREQFSDEAKQQNNCVEYMYLPRVSEGRTHVVFVRKDDAPDKSYISCEVTNEGYINQFYLSHNRCVTLEVDIEFKRLYQEHLRAHWDEE